MRYRMLHGRLEPSDILVLIIIFLCLTGLAWETRPQQTTVSGNTASLMEEGIALLDQFRADARALGAGTVLEMTDTRLVFVDRRGNAVHYAWSDGLLWRNGRVLSRHLSGNPLRYLDFRRRPVDRPERMAFLGVALMLNDGRERCEVEGRWFLPR